MKQPTLYLASQSPRRRELLEKANIRFQVLIPKDKELPAPKTTHTNSPISIVKKIARHKGRAAIGMISSRKSALVLSADTLVFHKKQVLGKPKNKEHAMAMLASLSGKTHFVYTGVNAILLVSGKIVREMTIAVKTEVTFLPLRWQVRSWYVNSGEPMDKAGSYGAQEVGAIFIKKISGSYTNVVGLPIGETMQLIEKVSRMPYLLFLKRTAGKEHARK